MKIDLVIHSSDSNPFYLDFWPIVSKIWKEVFHLEPVLLYIDENHDIPIDDTYGKVVKFKPVADVPLYLQCLWIRYWYPSQHPDKVSMISDIDMLPISKTYFIDQIAEIPDDKYVHLNPQDHFLPSCYHVARGSLFKQVLGLEEEWVDSVTNLFRRNLGHDCFHGTNLILKDKLQWGADEEYATQQIRGYPDSSLFVMLPRRHRRIDRSYWVYTEEDIRNDKYADSHSLRPYTNYKHEIDSLVRILSSPPIRVLVLSIASDGNDIYKAEQNLWRTYMKQHPNIDCYFIKSSATFPHVCVFDDTIYVPGEERLDTIKHKTIEAIRYCLRDQRYTHILRTNLSSFWIWERFISALQSLPQQRLYAGIVGNHNGMEFASGAGYVMSRDVANELIRTPFPDYTRIDDLDVGIFLNGAGYNITPLSRSDNPSNTDPMYYHYRLKSMNRLEEVDTMRKMIERHYS